jgi:hypothetical protein
MKVKVYKVYPKNNPDLWYLVDAPSKRIAKWCGAAIVNNEYACFLTAKDMKVERFKAQEYCVF